MKRVAIPVNEGKLSEYFGRCQYYEIYDIDGESVTGRRLELPEVQDVGQLPEWASKKGITDIITYKIEKRIIMLFNQHKINLFVGIELDTPQKLIEEFINGQMISSQKIIAEIINN